MKRLILGLFLFGVSLAWASDQESTLQNLQKDANIPCLALTFLFPATISAGIEERFRDKRLEKVWYTSYLTRCTASIYFVAKGNTDACEVLARWALVDIENSFLVVRQPSQQFNWRQHLHTLLLNRGIR